MKYQSLDKIVRCRGKYCSGLIGVMEEKEVASVNFCLTLLGKKPLQSYTAKNGVAYVGLLKFSPHECPYTLSYAYNLYCQNHDKIREFLLEQNIID